MSEDLKNPKNQANSESLKQDPISVDETFEWITSKFPRNAPKLLNEWLIYGLSCHQNYSGYYWTNWEKEFDDNIEKFFDDKDKKAIFKLVKTIAFENQLADFEKRDSNFEKLLKKIKNSKIKDFIHSKNYMYINYSQREYFLTERQAQVISILHQNHLNGICEVESKFILKALFGKSYEGKNIKKDVFKNSTRKKDDKKTYEDLITSKDCRKGMIRLNFK